MSSPKLLRWSKSAVALLVMLSAGLAQAGQTSGAFTVSVNLQTGAAPAENGFCRITDDPHAFGAIVTVVCSTGAVVDLAPGRAGAPLSPMHGGAYRFVTQIWGAGPEGFDASEGGWGAGTTTSWRVIHLANREYYEMMVAW